MKKYMLFKCISPTEKPEPISIHLLRLLQITHLVIMIIKSIKDLINP
jgi:hypothetical protein